MLTLIGWTGVYALRYYMDNPASATVRIKNLPLQKKFKDMLLERSETLLPVQALSIEAGLLEGKNQFVVSATATERPL